jgi:hypothetical protein
MTAVDHTGTVRKSSPRKRSFQAAKTRGSDGPRRYAAIVRFAYTPLYGKPRRPPHRHLHRTGVSCQRRLQAQPGLALYRVREDAADLAQEIALALLDHLHCWSTTVFPVGKWHEGKRPLTELHGSKIRQPSTKTSASFGEMQLPYRTIRSCGALHGHGRSAGRGGALQGAPMPSLEQNGVVSPLHTADVHRSRAFGPGGRMPHIASPSRAPEDGHGDSANSGDVHRDYQDIPVRSRLRLSPC